MSSKEVIDSLETIQSVARKMATCFQDANAIWSELKALDSDTLQSILDQYQGTTQPVQMYREYVAWKLLAGTPWGNEQHLALMEAIVRLNSGVIDQIHSELGRIQQDSTYPSCFQTQRQFKVL